MPRGSSPMPANGTRDDRSDGQDDSPSRLCPRAAQAHFACGRQAAHRGASPDTYQAPRHDAPAGRFRLCGRIGRRCRRTGASCSTDTGSRTSRSRSWASGASGSEPSSACSWVVLTTTAVPPGKQAEASVYERYLGPSEHASHGERVVTGHVASRPRATSSSAGRSASEVTHRTFGSSRTRRAARSSTR